MWRPYNNNVIFILEDIVIHYLRNDFNRTIVDIEASKTDLHALVDIEHYTSFLDKIENKVLRRRWISDMSRIQELRGEFHETPCQSRTPDEFARFICNELSDRWGLYYVTD
jgi:Mor family transcriptional regulator